MTTSYIAHFGIPDMRWYHRRFQNEDGSLTEAGKRRYYNHYGGVSKAGMARIADAQRKAKALFNEKRTYRATPDMATPEQRLGNLAKTASANQKAYDELTKQVNRAIKKYYPEWKSDPRDFDFHPYENISAIREKAKNGKDRAFDRALNAYNKATAEYMRECRDVTERYLKMVGETRLYDWRESDETLSVYDERIMSLLTGGNVRLPLKLDPLRG